VVGGLMEIFVILLCDFSGTYMSWIYLFAAGFNVEIFGGFWDVLSGFLQTI
jgi:hypothetical protein